MFAVPTLPGSWPEGAEQTADRTERVLHELVASAPSAFGTAPALAPVAPADVSFDARVPVAELDAVFPRRFGFFDDGEAAVAGLGTEYADSQLLVDWQGVAEHGLGVTEPVSVDLG